MNDIPPFDPPDPSIAHINLILMVFQSNDPIKRDQVDQPDFWFPLSLAKLFTWPLVVLHLGHLVYELF